MERIAILGAGPIGLEVALALSELGRPFVLFEAGPSVGTHLREWGHVRLFTPWSMNVSERARRACASAGVELPAGAECPTGQQLVEGLLEPVAALPEIEPHVRLSMRVVGIAREGHLKNSEIGTGVRASAPFRLLLRADDGRECVEYAAAVIDCTGTWGQPNAVGSGGIPAPGEGAAAEWIRRTIPNVGVGTGDRDDLVGRRIVLVGAGHSGQTAARSLAELVADAPETRVTWLIRSAAPDFAVDEEDPLVARTTLGATARSLALDSEGPLDVRLGRGVEEIVLDADALRIRIDDDEWVEADRVIALTGSVGDASIYRQLQVHECYATSGPMKLAAALLSSSSADCLAQETHGADTLENPEPDFYILGSKSYGRNNTFLLRVGWEQVNELVTLLPDASSSIP